MNGSAGLWPLWQAVSAALADGRSYERLPDIARGPAGRAAVTMLAEQLRAHDMLVEVPRGWGESDDPADPPPRIADWLAAVAADPALAWERIGSAAAGVGGRGPVAAAAARALVAAGVRILPQDGDDHEPGMSGPPAGAAVPAPPVLLRAGDASVAAAAGGETGFVTPVGTPGSARRDAELIGDRIGLPPGTPPAAVLAALVGGAAAHRLVCAVAGLSDPGEDALAASPAAPSALGRPTALIARLDPLSASYHPWWDTAEAGPETGRAADPDAVPARLEALTDPETGVLPVLALDDLPQLPAGLARCRVGDTDVCGIGVDTAMARLSCATAAAERLIALDAGVPVAVGADLRHAEGVRLRRLLHATAPRTDAATVPQWALSPAARRWFKAVTLRFGARADLRVRRLAPGVFHAELRDGTELSGWAVESTEADAAAVCALAAAGALQWRTAGGDPGATVGAPCGAVPLPRADGPGAAPGQADAWIRSAGATDREDTLQRELRRLLGARAGAARLVAPAPGLLQALAVAGFAVLETSP